MRCVDVVLLCFLQLCVLQLRLGCETGVAHVESVLSVPRSLLANADVALLKNYHSESLARCMEECCSGTYGSCTVASFKRNTTKENCMHFYCRPLNKCKFTSSNSTDTFSFSSEPRVKTQNTSTSTSTTTTTTTTTSATREEIAPYSEEQFALKNDNTTVKPRKGVEQNGPLEDLHAKSGVKPRKGVSTQDVPHSELIPNSLNKSNVKARKGVSNPTEVPHSSAKAVTAAHVVLPRPVEDINTNELMSELQKVFEDDLPTSSVESTSTSDWTPSVAIAPTLSSTQSTNYEGIAGSHTELSPSYSTRSSQLDPSSKTKMLMDHATMTRQFVSAAVEEIIVPFSSTPTNVPSPSTTQIQSSKVSSMGEGFHQKLGQQSSLVEDLHQKHEQSSALGEGFHQELGHQSSLGAGVHQEKQSSLGEGLHQELGHQSPLGEGFHQKLVQSSSMREVLHQELGQSSSSHKKLVSLSEDEETETDRRYKSSIHLVLSLVFGLLVLFAVLGVVAKRVYDGWLRRDYYRMNYLIDGIYNGVD